MPMIKRVDGKDVWEYLGRDPRHEGEVYWCGGVMIDLCMLFAGVC